MTTSGEDLPRRGEVWFSLPEDLRQRYLANLASDPALATRLELLSTRNGPRA